MSCRGGVGAVRGGSSALQPIRATVPFQLHSKTQPTLRESRTVAERTKLRVPKPSIRRTLSLDTIVGPYLQGQWPRDLEPQAVYCTNDKATQTPTSWPEEAQGHRGGGGGIGHKRSASWGSAEHRREFAKLKQQLQQHAKPGGRRGSEHEKGGPPSASGTTQTMPIAIALPPLVRLAPRLRCSVEGLNQELEGVFVQDRPEKHRRVLDVPDGHRAPVPPQHCSSGSQSDPSPALLSSSPSPCSFLSPLPLGDTAPDMDTDSAGCWTPTCSPPYPPGGRDPSPLQLSRSPRPNKSYSFQREPPEGCERVRVSEEAIATCLGESPLLSSCPDPNKVNFIPHGGSAFCPVSLLKPLLPTVDFLFRNLSVSPVTGCSGQGVVPYPGAAAAVGVYLGPQPDAATTAM